MQWKPTDSPAEILAGLVSCAQTLTGDRSLRMRTISDSLWDTFCSRGVSWIGFYEIAGAQNDHGIEPGSAMLLGPHRDKPACSPIGLHGVCGRSWSQRTSLVVSDIEHLGEGYVACDPRDVAELVIPCMDEDRSCWGVLDADSFERACFDKHDAAEIWEVLSAAGLTAGASPQILQI